MSLFGYRQPQYEPPDQYEEPRYDQVQDPEPVVVHVASSDAKPVRSSAPEYGTTMTFSVDTVVNLGKPIQLLPQRYRRAKAVIHIPSMSTMGVAGASQNQQTAPTANTVITSIPAANIVPGEYVIKWIVSLASGAPAAADVDNFRLKTGSTSLATSANAAALGNYPQSDFGPIFLNGQSNVNIIAVANATAGVVYAASLELVPVQSPTGASLIINSKQEPLMNPVLPQGFTISVAPFTLEWVSQKPCYATITGNGPVAVSVFDQAYEET